jgi:predicted HTH domain antitoxin
MKTIHIEIPKEIVLSLKMRPEMAKKQLKEELAVHLYGQGFLSFGKARQLAEMTKWDFAEKLGELQIPRHYTRDDLEEDFEFAFGDSQ